ncbi:MULTISPECIES: ArsA family ATPase [unclassified Leptolyngbya]|uniref:Get3/ArsA fold putative tail anchor-mediating ATPase NosAFP n=1 Tax=unclassified Leptolyngbya TaxID=2650499 RepID=UPI0016825F52|nr:MULTISPECIES: ArsA family ATPase [unclassified Leptolyngbya]MBD1910697.1 ArsA family ATPase [Leptolyngbya sp. FACHB-8]MBD2154294.1 ArsA family ATPase [Leptolyngbya sp. FACHB-16]
MSLILTFLGKGGTGRTTVAIAAAHKLAAQGKRVLLATQDPSPAFGVLLGTAVGAEPVNIAPNLKALQLQSTALLERSWDELKQQEARYVRSPFLKGVYAQELGILPGMDSALALNALREFDASGNYDVVVYDGAGDQNTLRMLGTPEIATWYVRRFRTVLTESDFYKTLSPFIQPVSSAVLNVNWSGDLFSNAEATQVGNILEQGKAAVTDPKRMLAYLVTTEDEAAIATAKYLWGAAQQIGLTVGGVVLNQSNNAGVISSAFEPLSVSALPNYPGQDWQPLANALPDLTDGTGVPKAIAVNVSERKVALFLPGFDKSQVKLTQYGPEVTVEAGDQRHNLALPPELKGKQVTGAKFQDGYLIISF